MKTYQKRPVYGLFDSEKNDGVKVNYAKFQNVELPQGEGKKPHKANLLAKI